MLVFLDFEASSLGRRSWPVEVAWVFEGGTSEAHLIDPAEGWDDWDAAAQAIHGLDLARLRAEGMSAAAVARRMAAELGGHDLCASAPSWDGKWLSVLLRAGGLPRHALRLRDSDDVHREAACAILAPVFEGAALEAAVAEVLAASEPRAPGEPPAHRALADAEEERQRWLLVRRNAAARASAKSS